MKHHTLNNALLCLALASAAVLATAPRADARHNYAVSGYAGVNVWIDGGDVFDGYDDVTVWLRAERDCYTTLFLVDTAGFVHVLYPRAACDDGWVHGGAAYCYRAGDLGLDRLDGVGIAYVFAVGSPVPFDYSPYGARIFVGGYGYRITGDPFVACRDFYGSLLPVSCRWDYVGVSYARFYVREWVRYPSYLCVGGPGFHVSTGGGCRLCDDVYVSYRAHVAAPYEAIRPAPKFKRHYAERQLTGRVTPVRVAEPTTVQRPSFKRTHAATPARVVSTSRRHAYETEARGSVRATGAMTRARVEPSPVRAVPAGKSHTRAKANVSDRHTKGARREAREAE